MKSILTLGIFYFMQPKCKRKELRVEKPESRQKIEIKWKYG
jgi:hypothetical protein